MNEQFSILYEDKDLLVINKPSGLLSIRDGYNPKLPNLSDLLITEYGRVLTVHRLDKETSGVIIFCRTAAAHISLNQQFQERKNTKTYHAMISNCPPWENALVCFPLRINGDRSHRTIIDYYSGKPAATKFRVICSYSHCTIIQAEPLSGYTHQIRIHLSSIGHPVLLDQLYGKKGDIGFLPPKNSRLALHAYSISFLHPSHNLRVNITAPYPKDFEGMIEALK
jgi:RluA family pseudouridine synthase